MNKPRFLDRRIGFSVGALGMLFAMVAPAVMPAFVSAAQIQTRSIQMSSSATSATGVSYLLTFTPQTTGATDMLVYFCSNSPLSGVACTAPTGLSLSSATVTAGTGTSGAALDTTDTGNPGGPSGAHNIIAIKSMTMGTSASTLTINNVTNPSTTGTFYARIQTYSSNGTQESAYTAGATDTTYTDNGGVALSATNQIGVTAAVLESMQFCVFGDPNNNTGGSSPTQGTADSSTYVAGLTTDANGPTTGCNDSSHSSPSPSTQLGQVSSNVSALSTTTPSYAAEWAQLSTNANTGAIVYMKTNNQCVGLFRAGEGTAADCQIPSAGASAAGSLAAGTAGFGVSFGPAVSDGTTPSGAIDLNSAYANASSDYTMLSTGTSSGGDANGSGLTENVDSTYGGYVFGTGQAPASDWDIPFGLGASISNQTPAGNYSANLNLIAVGTF